MRCFTWKGALINSAGLIVGGIVTTIILSATLPVKVENLEREITRVETTSVESDKNFVTQSELKLYIDQHHQILIQHMESDKTKYEGLEKWLIRIENKIDNIKR